MSNTQPPSSYRTPPVHPPDNERPVLVARPIVREREMDTDPLGMVVASAVPVAKQSAPEVETKEADGTRIKPHYPIHRLYFIVGGSLAVTWLAAWLVDANPTTLTFLCVFSGLVAVSGLLDYISNRRKLVTSKVQSDSHNNYLVVSVLEGRKEHWYSHKVWTRTNYTLVLRANPHVDVKLATKCQFWPTDGETEVVVLKRFSWFKHGLYQMAIWVVGGAGVYGLSRLLHQQMIDRLLVVWALAAIASWYFVWIKWAYEYFVTTDKRVMDHYRPPWQLKGFTRTAKVGNIITTDAVDQKPSALCNLLGFGILKCDTVVQEGDDWLREGLKFVTDNRGVSRTIQNTDTPRPDSD